MIGAAARVLIPSAISFAFGIILAPLLAHYLYKFHAWKKRGGKGNGIGGGGTPIFDSLHKEREVSTPRMGGILIWVSTLITALGLWGLGIFVGGPFAQLSFIDRSQTWLPLTALVVGALGGLFDDVLEVREGNGGLRLRTRLLIVGLMGLFAAWWFYTKLGVSSVGVPFNGPLDLHVFFIPFFVLVTLATYAGGTIDGIDGLSGGVFSIIFMIYSSIAFVQGQFTLAAFAATVAGAILAFLWFNIPPARFYMSETGSMALTLALAITAFSADAVGGGVGVLMLPIIAFPLFATVITTLLQVFWKRYFGRKLFRIAPIHHHFEAIGWPPAKVTMRYWVMTIILGVLGLSLALLGAGR
ncbi:MAG: hypothetical protein B7X04_00940 [Parcubacteria group bacterium 21-54-25]|nr:MAG: hypothetical protein B7X04_00940 [Parcubacteria group bacterium 21-54-25]HQU07797.1 hypothetical protein [Candidatus Paceibacterota bacterium]